MDHTQLRDGAGTVTALAIRDLSSGRTLVFRCEAATAYAVAETLREYFARHGAPLVLKSDNGSAFVNDAVQSLLAECGVVHLRSPVRRPAYNGACEAAMKALKEVAIDLSIERGVPVASVTQEAAGILNAMTRRRAGASPDELWEERTELGAARRRDFAEAVARRRRQAVSAAGLASAAELTHAHRESLERAAVRDALCEFDFLMIQRP